MSTDYRALCAELLVALKSWSPHGGGPLECWEDREEEAALIARARAALTQPEPVAPTPTDEEIGEWHDQCADLTRLGEVDHYWAFDLRSDEVAGVVRAALARWGTPTAQPVPVSERPKPGDWVWHCYAGVRFWEHGRYNGRQFFIGDGPESQPATHWLPHWALPVPANTINQED
jgi:hypothetical protein